MNYPPDTHVTFKPDNRVFASYPMPAKINLINEKPRHEQEVEQQLSSRISPTFQQHQTEQLAAQEGSLYHQQQQQNQRQFTDEWSNEPLTRQNANYAAELNADLAKKEAHLREEIDALQRRPYNPYQSPSKIDITSENQCSRSYQSSPRPLSAASNKSTRDYDLANKEADLMKEIAEIEQKPYNPQKILLEHEKWYEYPEGHPEYRQLADTKRRVKDFCSMPSHLYPDGGNYIHEENLSSSLIGSSRGKSASPLSVHTAIIKTPKREIDNRSPLPFAFDNFSTGGIKGNIATVGAVEPERPYPPINPIIVRRSPTPNIQFDSYN